MRQKILSAHYFWTLSAVIQEHVLFVKKKQSIYNLVNNQNKEL